MTDVCVAATVGVLSVRERHRLWLLEHEFADARPETRAENAPRLALLVASKGAREDRERVRVNTVNALNLERDPAARRVRGASTITDVLFITAMMLVIVSVALTLLMSMGDLFDRDDAIIVWLGATAGLGIALLAWCDPMRGRGEVFYTGTSSDVFLTVRGAVVRCFRPLPLSEPE